MDEPSTSKGEKEKEGERTSAGREKMVEMMMTTISFDQSEEGEREKVREKAVPGTQVLLVITPLCGQWYF